jgi:Protein of unknown function (DUF4087)
MTPALPSIFVRSACSLGGKMRLGLLLICAMVGAQTSLADAGPPKGQWRCGWFENPTPANAWFTDREGEWLIGVQGGHQAQGDWPSFPPWRWVRTNGHYGYGCACMRMLTDPSRFTVTKILTGSSRSLSTCRKDATLKEPKLD